MTSSNARVALVTGGAQGIGHAIGLSLARDGVTVFAADVQLPGSSASAAIRFVRADVSRCADVEAMFKTIESATPGVDLLVNNAGILRSAPLGEVSRDAWDATMRVNLEAPFFVAQRAAATMVRLGRGHIVNVSSTSAFVSSYNQSVYEISKAGVAAMTRALDWSSPPAAFASTPSRPDSSTRE